jgi:hypothetical protein
MLRESVMKGGGTRRNPLLRQISEQSKDEMPRPT